MSSDFNFTITSRFLGNVRIKPYFKIQCPNRVDKNRILLTAEPLPPLFVHAVTEWPLSYSKEPISTSQFLAEVFFQGVEWWRTDKQIDRVPLWFHSKRIQPNSGPSKSVKVSNHRNYASNFETTSTPSCPPLLNSSSLQYVHMTNKKCQVLSTIW